MMVWKTNIAHPYFPPPMRQNQDLSRILHFHTIWSIKKKKNTYELHGSRYNAFLLVLPESWGRTVMAWAKSLESHLPAQPLQPRTTMGDGLETCSIQNSTSSPQPPLIFNPSPPETCDPMKPRRQTNQLQALSISTTVTPAVLLSLLGLRLILSSLFFSFSVSS